MENYVNGIMDFLWNQSGQLALWVAAVFAISLCLKHKSAHVRYGLWLVVLVKCIMPPVMEVPLALLPESPAVEVAAMPQPAPVPLEKSSVPPDGHSVPLDGPAKAVPPKAPVLRDTPGGHEPAVVAGKASVGEVLKASLPWCWLAGVLMFLGLVFVKALKTTRWLRRSRRPLPDGQHERLKPLYAKLGLGSVPALWILRDAGQPFVWGLVRGAIYLPDGFLSDERRQYRDGIMGHELSHVVRFDAAVNAVQLLVQAMFWFHPLVWLMNGRIRLEREKCCDESTIARLGTAPGHYGAAIVDVLEAECRASRPVPSLAVAGTLKHVEGRIRAILRPGKTFYKGPRRRAIFAMLLMALLVVPTALALTQRPTDDAVEKEIVAAIKARRLMVNLLLDKNGHAMKATMALAGANPETMAMIRKLPNLRELSFCGCAVRSGYLSGFKSVTRVMCRGSTVLTGKAMKDLGRLTRLEALTLSIMPAAQSAVSRTGNKEKFVRVDAGFGGEEAATVHDLKHLKGLTRLKRFVLRGQNVTNDALGYIGSLKHLESLALCYAPMTGKGLEHLKGLPGLTALKLESCSIDDAGIACLREVTQLAHLEIAKCSITDRGLAHLHKMKRLQALTLRCCDITDAGFAHLAALSGLRELNIGSIKITGSGLAYLKDLKSLREIRLVRCGVTAEGLASVQTLPRLQFLDLTGNKFGDAGIPHLAASKTIETLRLGGNNLSGAGLGALKHVKTLVLTGNKAFNDGSIPQLLLLDQLETLQLTLTRVTDAGLPALKALPKLRRLNLQQMPITSEGMKGLHEFPALETLLLGQTRVDDGAVPHLARLKGLKQLLIWNTKISKAGEAELQKALPGCTISRMYRLPETDD